MATFTATHTPFLHSRAKLLILPTSSDGTILYPTLLRAKSLYPSYYATYHKKALNGDFKLGDVWLYKQQTQVTGLDISNNQDPSYLVSLITHHHAKHPTQARTLIHACTQLQPQLFTLMRYIAFTTSPYLPPPCLPNAITLRLSPLKPSGKFAKAP